MLKPGSDGYLCISDPCNDLEDEHGREYPSSTPGTCFSNFRRDEDVYGSGDASFEHVVGVIDRSDVVHPHLERRLTEVKHSAGHETGREGWVARPADRRAMRARAAR